MPLSQVLCSSTSKYKGAQRLASSSEAMYHSVGDKAKRSMSRNEYVKKRAHDKLIVQAKGHSESQTVCDEHVMLGRECALWLCQLQSGLSCDQLAAQMSDITGDSIATERKPTQQSSLELHCLPFKDCCVATRSSCVD